MDRVSSPEVPHGHAHARAKGSTEGEPIDVADQVGRDCENPAGAGEHERAGAVDPDDAERGMHAEQLFRRPPEPVRLGAVPLDEVECVAPDASPCVRPEAGTRVAVGGEAKESLAPG
jgi:hypothetical protein